MYIIKRYQYYNLNYFIYYLFNVETMQKINLDNITNRKINLYI